MQTLKTALLWGRLNVSTMGLGFDTAMSTKAVRNNMAQNTVRNNMAQQTHGRAIKKKGT